MSARWTLTIKCDRCPRVYGASAVLETNVRYGPKLDAIRKAAGHEGWACFHGRRSIDLCPGHARKASA